MKKFRSNFIHSGVVSFKRLRGLSLFAALALLTACGGGGGGGSSSSPYHVPYSVDNHSDPLSLHLVNTSTLADEELAANIDSIGASAYYPYQVESDGRLVALPASHVFYLDATSNRLVRKSLKSGSSFQFPEGCEWQDKQLGESRPAVPWASFYCGANLKLVNLMATSGDGMVVDLSASDVINFFVVAGIWDATGKPSGLIAWQNTFTDSDFKLYRYHSDDWSHPEALKDTAGDPVTAASYPGADEGVRASTGNQFFNVEQGFWLRANNGAADDVWYYAKWKDGDLTLAKAPAVLHLESASNFSQNNGELFYTKTSGGTVSFYRLSLSRITGFLFESTLASTGAGLSSIQGFTPTRMIWFDDGNEQLKSTLLTSTGEASYTEVLGDRGFLTNLHVSGETVYFSMLTGSDRHTSSYQVESDGSGLTPLGDGKLFRAAFSGINSGTTQDDGQLYLADVDVVGSGNPVLKSARLDDLENFITLGSVSGYSPGVCDDASLSVKVARAPASTLASVGCGSGASAEFALEAFKPDKADSLHEVLSPALTSARKVELH